MTTLSDLMTMHLGHDEPKDDPQAAMTPVERAAELLARFRLFSEPKTFAVGDLVTQVIALGMYRWPRPGLAAVVTATFARRAARHDDETA